MHKTPKLLTKNSLGRKMDILNTAPNRIRKKIKLKAEKIH